MAKKITGRIRRLTAATGVIGGAIAVTAVVLGSASAQSTAGRAVSHHGPSPAVLPAASGYARIDGMTQVLTGRIPLWTGKDSAGPYRASAYGLVASLGQGFVLSPAVREFGTLSSRPGLPLPLPLAFAGRHPGPAEVFDTVRAFTTASAPARLLHDPVFADTDVQGVTALRSGAVHGGLAWRVVSAANGGMSEYRFEWADGTRLTGVSVIGAQLTLGQARQVALAAG
jgi:hypothetical protein